MHSFKNVWVIIIVRLCGYTNIICLQELYRIGRLEQNLYGQIRILIAMLSKCYLVSDFYPSLTDETIAFVSYTLYIAHSFIAQLLAI